MRNLGIILCILFSMTLSALAQDDKITDTHILKKGDTLQSLAKGYGVCREAIIWQNQLASKSMYSRAYVLPEGTELEIPPVSACDDLPEGMWTITVLEGETPTSLMSKYRFNVNGMFKKQNGESIWFDTHLEVGEEYLILDIAPFYNNELELFVFDEDDNNEPIPYELQVGDTLLSLVERFDTCREGILWLNEFSSPHRESLAYFMTAGEEILIPHISACDEIPAQKARIKAREGDTLEKINQRYNQDMSMMEESNYSLKSKILKAGTEVNIPHLDWFFQTGKEMRVETAETYANPTPIIHYLTKTDNFQSLQEQYDTCIPALIYANNLPRAGTYNSSYNLKAGTELKIPPAWACDNLPTGSETYVVEAGDTLYDIGIHYNLMVYEIARANPQIVNPNLIEIDDEIFIPDISRAYIWNWSDRLVVYDDSDVLHDVINAKAINQVAECYGISTESVLQANNMQYDQVIVGRLIIPEAQHPCVIRETLGADYACYEKRLEELVGLPLSDEANYVFQAEDNLSYCYSIHKAYDILFQDKPVILYDATYMQSLSNARWITSAEIIRLCYRNNGDEYMGNVAHEYYASDMLPPTNMIAVIPQPKGVNCTADYPNQVNVHRVVMGESLTSLAKAYGLLPEHIADANNLPADGSLREGQYLIIPQPTFFQLAGLGGFLFAMFAGGFGLRRYLRRRHAIKPKRKMKESL